jgi:nicotinamidase-related amidase
MIDAQGLAVKQINGLSIPTSLADVVDPTRAALLVYDMQVGIVRQISGGEGVSERCARILQAARKAGFRIAFSRHLSLPKSWMGSFQYRMAMAWQRKDDPAQVAPWFLRDNPGTQIMPELAPRQDEAVFDKLAMSAFEGTPLEFAMRDCGLSAIILIGIATEIGIEPTARHAADLGIIPIIVTDALGCGHNEAAERSIEALRFAGDALFTTVDELIALMGAARPA